MRGWAGRGGRKRRRRKRRRRKKKKKKKKVLLPASFDIISDKYPRSQRLDGGAGSWVETWSGGGWEGGRECEKM